MATGVVKWFNNVKGFGFIVPDDGSEDLFAHYSSINGDGFRTIKAGQLVSFDVDAGEKGAHAKNISVVEDVFAPQNEKADAPKHLEESF